MLGTGDRIDLQEALSRIVLGGTLAFSAASRM